MAAYADDVLALTNSAEGLALQALKIQKYSDWLGLRPNFSKCATTGALYGYARQCGDTHPFADSYTQMLQDRLKGVLLARGTPEFCHPQKPYKYLGVELTMSLDWKHHVASTLQLVKDKSAAILASAASPKQKLQYIQTSIRPCVVYAVGIDAFTPQDIRQLDAAQSSIAKASFYLPVSTPGALVCRRQEDGGMGLQSLLVDFAQIAARSLTLALNDTGPLSISTRAMLAAQHKEAAGQQVLHLVTGQVGRALDRGTRHLHLLRQLCMLKDARIAMRGPQAGSLTITCDGPLTPELLAANGPSLLSLEAEDDDGAATVVGYMPDLMACGLLTLDSALVHEEGQLVMRPASWLCRCSGEAAYRRHRITYTRLTALLHSGVASKSQAAKDLPADKRVVTQLDLLARFCSQDPQAATEASASACEPPARRQAAACAAAPRKAARLLEKVYRDECKKQSSSQARKRKAAAPAPARLECKRQNTDGRGPPRKSPCIQALDTSPAMLIVIGLMHCQWHQRTTRRPCRTYSTAGWPALPRSRPGLSMAPPLRQQCWPSMMPISGLPSSWTSVRTAQAGCCEVVALCSAAGPPAADSWENASSVHQQPECEHLFGPYMQQRAVAAQRVRHDSGLTQAQLQGSAEPSVGTCLSLTARPELRPLIHINPLCSCNPDTDRCGTGAFSIAVSALDDQFCTVHTPSGCTVGSLPLSRLDLLHTAHLAHAGQQPGFEEALARLLVCRQQQSPGNLKDASPPRPIPAVLVRALAKGLQLQLQLFTSPLGFDPSLTAYCSACEEDAAFGAFGRPYGSPWGGSALCIPPDNDKAMDKALRWAIASATTLLEASLSVIVLPLAHLTAYQRWLAHPLVFNLLMVPGTAVPATAATAWRRSADDLVLVVANTAAQGRIEHDRLHACMSAACADLGLECPSLAALCTPGLQPHVCRGQGCACHMGYVGTACPFL